MSYDAEIVSVYLLRGSDEALFQLRDNKPGLIRAGIWVPPGGHREAGESEEAAGAREFLEETGYRCDALKYLGCEDDPVENHLFRLHMFWSIYDGVSPITCFEGQELRFLSRRLASEFAIPEICLRGWDAALAARDLTSINAG